MYPVFRLANRHIKKTNRVLGISTVHPADMETFTKFTICVVTDTNVEANLNFRSAGSFRDRKNEKSRLMQKYCIESAFDGKTF